MIKFVFLLVFLSTPLKAELVDTIKAIVNDEIILQSELDKQKAMIKAGQILDDLYDLDKKELLNNNKALLNHLINEKIIESEIKRNDLSVTKEAVEKEIENVMKRNQINRDQLRQALKQEGTNFADYFDFIKQRMERQAIIQQSVTSKIRISSEDIEQYYIKNHGLKNTSAFQFQLAHILFNSEAEAKKTYNDLLAGANFSDLAEQRSKDSNFSSGGYLGEFKSGEMAKEIESAIKNKSEGEISAPVKTAAGIHIFKISSKKIISNPDLEEKRPQIRSILTQKALKEQFQFWLDQKRREAYIKINS